MFHPPPPPPTVLFCSAASLQTFSKPPFLCQNLKLTPSQGEDGFIITTPGPCLTDVSQIPPLLLLQKSQLTDRFAGANRRHMRQVEGALGQAGGGQGRGEPRGGPEAAPAPADPPEPIARRPQGRGEMMYYTLFAAADATGGGGGGVEQGSGILF